MRFFIRRCEVSLSFWFFAVLAAFLILDHSRIGVSSLLAVLLHEAAHLAAGMAAGLSPSRISLRPFGITIEMPLHRLSFLREIGVLFAGPAINLLCFLGSFFFNRYQTFGTLSLAMGLMQLLPFSALDGGGILRALFSAAGFGDGGRGWDILSFFLILPVFFGVIWLFLRGKTNLTVPIAALFLLLSSVRELWGEG